MNRKSILAAALALPLVVLSYTWATTDWQSRQGAEWLVPIRGYDPRDLLRGHYIQYRYDWPMAEAGTAGERGPPAAFDLSYASRLCIAGRAPDIRSVREVSLPLKRMNSDADAGCAAIATATRGARREVRGLDTGIFYASQARALALSQKLADPKVQALLRVRIRADGVMTPVDMEFRRRAEREE